MASSVVSIADAAELREAILGLLREERVEPVYRRKGVAVSEWTTDLPMLGGWYPADDGTDTNGFDPRNILVAFRRTEVV